MSKIKIEVDVSTLEKSKSQLITGIIFFDFMNYQFPEKGWNDSVVLLLSWWLVSLLKINLGESTHEELLFMEGPLYVRVEKLNGDRCGVKCFDTRSEGKVIFSGNCQVNQFLDSVRGAAEATYAACSQNGWDNDDIRKLKKLIGIALQ